MNTTLAQLAEITQGTIIGVMCPWSYPDSAPQKQPFVPGIHPSAVIGGTVSLDRAKVFIGPNAVIEDDVVIGDGCAIHAGAFIGRGSRLGQCCVIHANAVIKDRCVIGERVIIHSIIVAQVGISGCTRVGKNVTMADQVGVAGHLNIGDQITIVAKSGITKDMKEPGAYKGYPAKPLMEGRRVLALKTRLPEMFDILKKLEQRLEKLEGSGPDILRDNCEMMRCPMVAMRVT